jgi:hypothetical protein
MIPIVTAQTPTVAAKAPVAARRLVKKAKTINQNLLPP